MKSLMFIFLVSALSISKVWLRPTEENSELLTINQEEELRYKRQATFFDLLHQAIEKYASCADEHLAPLKSLATYKQYETLIPDKYSPTNKAIEGDSQTNAKKPNVKCTRVNLCTIINQNSHTETADNNNSAKLERALDSKNNISQLLPYFVTNEHDRTKQPYYMAKPYVSRSVLAKHGTKSSHYNNPYNKGLLNLFFNKPTAAHRKKILNAAEPETVVVSTLAKTATSVERTSCACLEEERADVVLNKTTKDYKIQEYRQDYNSCPCLESSSKHAQADSTRLEYDEVVEGPSDKNVLPDDSKEFDLNLDQLLMQLDEMAERASNGELRQIVEKLKNLKSAFDTNFESKEGYIRATTQVPFMAGVQVSQQAPKSSPNTPRQLSFSKLGLGLLNTIFKPKIVTKVIKGTDHGTALTRDSSDRGKGINNSFSEDSREIVTEEKTLHGKVQTFESHNLANPQDFVGITRHPALDESLEDYYTYSNQQKNYHASDRVAQAPAVSKKNINTHNPIAEYQANSSKLDKKDSKITISITSNGNFKNIHVEQHVPEDKKLEINEKEKMNMATPRSTRQYKDMVGTGSRLVHVVKQPQKIDSYAEPILSEIYSGKSKPTTKSPLSIYWHKIEKQPSTLNTAANGVWKTFQSGDVFEEENFAANSQKDINTSHAKRPDNEFT